MIRDKLPTTVITVRNLSSSVTNELLPACMHMYISVFMHEYVHRIHGKTVQ